MSFIPGKLDSDEIRQKIKKTDFPSGFTITEEEVNDILQMFWRQDAYNSLISLPVYLEYLISFLKEKRRATFTRSEFYSYFINKVVGKKKIIEHLMTIAVVMELAQVNEFPISKVDKILRKFKIKKSDLDIGRLKKENLVKVIKKEGKERSIGFYHHTIQEYLTAQLILQPPKPLKIAKEYLLIDQEGVIAIKPSWYGVLRFLLESDKLQLFVNWLLELASKSSDVVDEGFSDTITSIKPEKISKPTREAIFDLIYSTYQERQIWIPLWSRQNLAYLCGKKHLKQFRADIKPSKGKTETFVRQGNVADIISRLLEIESSLMTSGEKAFWKNQLIKFAKDGNENGVLQRHALSGLATYNDPDLIPKVKICFKHPDKLVREAFVQFCYETDPNDKQTVKYLVEGIKKGIDIYGRYGIYEIDEKRGVKELLNYFAKDEVFLRRFLDRESIFNDRGKKADKVLINHIKAVLDKDILKQLKSVIRTAFQAEDIYHHERSYFLEQLILVIKSKDSSYLFEAIKDIKKSDKNRWHLLCNYEYLFALIIKENDLKAFFEQIKELDEGKVRVAEMAVYKVKHLQGKKGEKVYQAAVKQNLIEPLVKQPAQQKPSREEDLYNEFKNLLEPEKGKYFPTVFEFFNQNYKELKPRLSEKNKSRLKKLVIDEGLKKIDPTKIKVKIPDKKKEPRKYNISSVASYYGDILKTALKLLSRNELEKYRKNIIDFIPFAYSDDQQTILEIVRKISDKNLEFVNTVYFNRDGDIRYLLPSSYIYMVKIYTERGCKLKTPPRILKSFIGDSLIELHYQKYALEVYGKFIKREDSDAKKYLDDLFNSKIKSKKREDLDLADLANGILISIFKDEKAIEWRFEELERRVVPFEEKTKFSPHWVSPIEEELDSLNFANPLINLGDSKYLPHFIKLLDFSLTLLKKSRTKKLQSYTEYLWRIVIAFIGSLKENGSFEPLKQLNHWFDQHKEIEGLNWFRHRLDRLREEYKQHLGKVINGEGRKGNT